MIKETDTMLNKKSMDCGLMYKKCVLKRCGTVVVDPTPKMCKWLSVITQKKLLEIPSI